ncbi:MAG: ABC transporter substrate-binding protein [Acidaminococcales bacterium]|nr:ABC transporter substrate-binding protein [Acidaminococcales bacterium]
MKKRFLFVLAVLLLCVLTAACGGGQGAGGQQAKWDGVINISLHQDPTKLDPSVSNAFVERHVFQSIFDKLADLNEKGVIVPMLAEKWDISPDGKKYTFYLRKNVKFHDGTDFNAAAVKFNFERNMAPSSIRRNELREVDKIVVVDNSTVEISLKNAFAPFLSILTDRAGMMVSPAAAAKLGQDFMSGPVGTGPFVFKERVKGATITLEKNKNYWVPGAPKADKIVYKIIADANVALVNLKSGQLDITNRFPFNEANNYAGDAKITVINIPSPGFRGMSINVTKAPLSNPLARQAIEALIDREAIVKVALNGIGTPGRSPFPPGNLAYSDLDKPGKPDLAKAKELLAKAGLGNGFSFTITTDTDPVSSQVAQMVQNMLKPAGINANLQKVDFGTMLDNATKGLDDASFINWSGREDPDQNAYDRFVTGGSTNFMKYSNPEMDKLLGASRQETDGAKRKALYDQVVALAIKDSPYIFFYHEHNIFGALKTVKGFIPVSDGMIRTINLSK